MDQELVNRVVKALENAGLHPHEIGGDPVIVNLHDAPAQTDGDDENYLATVTLTVTP